jgi:hypothetical protein
MRWKILLNMAASPYKKGGAKARPYEKTEHAAEALDCELDVGVDFGGEIAGATFAMENPLKHGPLRLQKGRG